MTADLAQEIAEAYRWQRRLGNTKIMGPGCQLVVDPAHPDVWTLIMPTRSLLGPTPRLTPFLQLWIDISITRPGA
ncbi:hypothetical protein [Bradyrhizobium sp. SZCCHNR2009]|uniref:hypothetical protein n=1 Tax=Bradyrhizobium sp. SZCCHNR2009 TaxID=3057375 RepID=UPI0028E481E7|nr:hypothetical protein [Bradyrhizobium sp. SZCCHNR2009]